MKWLNKLGEFGTVISICLVILIIFTIISIILFICDLIDKQYKKVFADQVDQLGKFIQGKEIVKFGDILYDDIWYKEGTIYSIDLPVTVTDTTDTVTKTTKTFKLWRAEVIHRNDEKLAIEIKTSQNSSNEPIVTIYVPELSYMQKIWHQRKIAKEQKFIEENYSTVFTSKGV